MSRKFVSARTGLSPTRRKKRSPWMPTADWYTEATRSTVRGKGTVRTPCVWCGQPSTHNLRVNGSKAIKICTDCVSSTVPTPLPTEYTLKVIGG